MSKKELQSTENAVVQTAASKPMEYTFSSYDMATPYMQMIQARYSSSNPQSAKQASPNGTYRIAKGKPQPLKLRADDLQMDYGTDNAYSAPMMQPQMAPEFPMAAPVANKKKQPKVKRTFFLLLVALFALLYVVVNVLGFLKVMPKYTSIYQVSIDEEFADTFGGDEESGKYAGLNDIVWSALAEFFGITYNPETGEFNKIDGVAVPEQACIIYPLLYAPRNVTIAFGQEVPLEYEIACYVIPIAHVLSVLVALYILIKAILSLFSKKRRKFAYASLFLFALTLLGMIATFVAFAYNQYEINTIVNFFTMTVPEELSWMFTVSVGGFVMLGTALLTWFFSLFAYRSRKKAGDGKPSKKSKKKRR